MIQEKTLKAKNDTINDKATKYKLGDISYFYQRPSTKPTNTMKSFKNPLWLFAAVTIPQILLFLLGWSTFSVIESLLDDEQIALWKMNATGLGIACGLFTTLGVVQLIYKRSVQWWVGIIVLFVYASYAGYALFKMNDLIPWDIPQWMFIGGDFPIYLFTFMMPAALYGLVLSIVHFTPNEGKTSIWPSLGLSIGIPLSCYLFVLFGINIPRSTNFDFFEYAMPVLITLVIVGFFFFFLRTMMIFMSRKKIFGVGSRAWTWGSLWWKVLLGIILPVLGLFINSGFFENMPKNVFGDFSNNWFFIIAVVNGLLLSVKPPANKYGQLLLFFGRSITLSFIFYFFLVFLPLLPLSFVLIFFFFTGLLTMVPMLLFFIQSNMLKLQFQELSTHFSKWVLGGLMVTGLAVLPTMVLLDYNQERKTLHQALDYIYSPNFSKTENINTERISNLVDNLVSFKKRRNGDALFDGGQPYLTNFYKWIVFDNLTLSNTKVNQIEQVFLGKETQNTTISSWRDWQDPESKNVKLDSTIVHSVYNKEADVWTSTIDLELRNTSGQRNQEYETSFKLPLGAFISDYYLWVGDRKEKGLLVEKRAALWTYMQITQTKRDPGLLYYLENDLMGFRVFPFNGDQLRKTGFEITHKEPFDLVIDGQSFLLGNNEVKNKNISTINEDDYSITYIPTALKEELPLVKRQPYLHFLMPAKDLALADFYQQSIDELIRENPNTLAPKFSLVGYQTETYDDFSKLAFSKTNNKGGFFLERAIKEIIYNNQNSETYPVFVILTDPTIAPIFTDDLSDWQDLYPDQDDFYIIYPDSVLRKYALLNRADKTEISKANFIQTKAVRQYKSKDTFHYLKDDKSPSIVFDGLIRSKHIKTPSWKNGLLLQAQNLQFTKEPHLADRYWLENLKGSFTTGFMTPLSSYMVVENEAQKQALLRKQKQLINGDFNLDAGEEVRMSEPSFWWGLLLMLVATRLKLLIIFSKPPLDSARGSD